MTDHNIGLIILFVLGGGGLVLAVQQAWIVWFSRPHEYVYGDMTFIWVPDDPEGLSFFRRPWKYGSFQYEDGTPVTDPQMERMLQEAWHQAVRPRDS